MKSYLNKMFSIFCDRGVLWCSGQTDKKVSRFGQQNMLPPALNIKQLWMGELKKYKQDIFKNNKTIKFAWMKNIMKSINISALKVKMGAAKKCLGGTRFQLPIFAELHLQLSFCILVFFFFRKFISMSKANFV